MKANLTRKVLNNIIKFLSKLLENQPAILSFSHIEKLIITSKEQTGLFSLFKIHELIQLLIDKDILKKGEFQFPHHKIIRYTQGDVPFYPVVQSLKPSAYFTHYTAVYLHNLTEQIPKTIYLNFEQPPKPRSQTGLNQERIDNAFRGQQRLSNNIAETENYRVCLLNGMYTNRLGVIELDYSYEYKKKITSKKMLSELQKKNEIKEYSSNKEAIIVEKTKLFVTNIERTLIDITVRPAYSGGVFEVLNAFKTAKEKVSVNKLTAILKKLNYIYPYHQAIGFYLEKSGYTEAQLDLFNQFELEYDFYLAHQMKNKNYSKKWRLFFPEGF